MVLDSVAYVVHTGIAALWAGSVLFVVLAVLPAADREGIRRDGLDVIVGRLLWITRASVLIAFVTGGHLAGTLYTADSLTGSDTGILVLVMLALWLLLAVAIEVGTARATRGASDASARGFADALRRYYLAAAIFATGLILVAGLLGADRLFGIL